MSHDKNGQLFYVAQKALRSVDANNKVVTLMGGGATTLPVNGLKTSNFGFRSSAKLFFDNNNVLYVSDDYYHCIYKIINNTLTVVAGECLL
jgi:hypothetical protein